MDGFDPGAVDTSVARALGLTDGVLHQSAAGVLGPGYMAAVTDHVDRGCELQEGPVSTRVSTRAAATGVVLVPTTSVVVLQHLFVDGIFYNGTGVQQVLVSAVVQLQAAARDFLARQRLQKTHEPMQDREAAFAAITFAFDVEGCDLYSLNVY
jgi:hypothetical protein